VQFAGGDTPVQLRFVDVLVVPEDDKPTGALGAALQAGSVVTLRGALCGDAPNVSAAETVNWNAVDGVRPVTTNAGDVAVPRATPFLNTVYVTQPAGALAAIQFKVVPVLVVEEAVSPAGAESTTLHPSWQVPLTVQGWPLPGPPLWVDGFSFNVHQFAV